MPKVPTQNLEDLSFNAFLRRMQSCAICDDLPLGPNPIFQLHPEARILIAGQAPGRITHAKNRPFDDPSGDRLRNWLGVDRGTFYQDPRIGIFPVGLCFPGSGKNGDHPPKPICASTWRAEMLDRLTQVKLVIVMGRYAIDWHLPEHRKATVTDAVRRGFEGHPTTCALPHPSPRNMRWFKANPWFELEILPNLRSRVQKLLHR